MIDLEPQGVGGEGGATTVTTTTTTATTITTTTSGGGMDFRIGIVSALGNANCQPAVPPDPMNVDFVLDVDNSQNDLALQLVVTAATIDSPEGSTAFDVVPLGTDLVAAGVQTTLPFAKVPGSAQGSSGCTYCNDPELFLTLEISAGGVPVTVEGPVDSFSCVF